MKTKVSIIFRKLYSSFFKYLIIGFFFTAIIHYTVSCKKSDNRTDNSAPSASVDSH